MWRRTREESMQVAVLLVVVVLLLPLPLLLLLALLPALPPLAPFPPLPSVLVLLLVPTAPLLPSVPLRSALLLLSSKQPGSASCCVLVSSSREGNWASSQAAPPGAPTAISRPGQPSPWQGGRLGTHRHLRLDPPTHPPKKAASSVELAPLGSSVSMPCGSSSPCCCRAA